MLADRLAKRMKHLARWGRRQGIGCFRVYERDIPDHPLVIDWYADLGVENPAESGDAVVWFHDRRRDEDLDEALAYRRAAELEILDGLGITRSRLFVKHRGRQRSGDGEREQYERIDSSGEVKFVLEHGSRFEINLSDYLDVGLFLDHRPTRRTVRERAAGLRVLNLFAYTGAFSVHARAGGAARTTTVDMSRTYLDWYERNLRLNGYELDLDHRAIRADCLQWLEEGPSTEERYDLIICDPPTFSNSKRMKAGSFAIDRDYPQLLEWIARFTAPGGEVFFSTNSRSFELDPAHVPSGFGAHEISRRSVPEDFRNRRIHRCWRLAEGWQPKRKRKPGADEETQDQQG